MDIHEIPDILDSLNEYQTELLNQTVTESIKRTYLDCYIPRDLEHEKIEGAELTYGEVFKTLSKGQIYAMYLCIEIALAEVQKQLNDKE